MLVDLCCRMNHRREDAHGQRTRATPSMRLALSRRAKGSFSSASRTRSQAFDKLVLRAGQLYHNEV